MTAEKELEAIRQIMALLAPFAPPARKRILGYVVPDSSYHTDHRVRLIREYRAKHGCGLIEAMDAVDIHLGLKDAPKHQVEPDLVECVAQAICRAGHEADQDFNESWEEHKAGYIIEAGAAIAAIQHGADGTETGTVATVSQVQVQTGWISDGAVGAGFSMPPSEPE